MLFASISLLVLVGYLIVACFWAVKFLRDFARNVFIVLTIVEVVLAGLNVLAWQDIPAFWKWFLDLDLEMTAGTIFSAAQLFVVGLAAFINSLRAPSFKSWHRLYWWFMAAVFVFLSMDEYFKLHEEVIGLATFRTWYVLVGTIMVSFTIALYWLDFRAHTKIFGLLLTGLAIMGLSGLAAEPFVWLVICPTSLGGLCGRFLLFEEFFEMVGASVVLVGFLCYAQLKPDEISWLRTKRALVLGGALCSALFVGNIWLFPALEARLLAKPVQVEYLDGTLSLLAYRTSLDVVAPGDTLVATLYWQADDFLSENYNLSAHVLTHPEISSVAQSDIVGDPVLGVYPTTAWLPGIAVRTVFRLELPQDLATPRSYWLMIRVWHDSQEITITQADRAQIATDTLILLSVPALSDTTASPPEVEANYRFADGFTLYGYALPETGTLGQEFTLKFWWQPETDVDKEIIQFVHILNSNGIDFDYIVHDQEPFGGSFPVADWPIGIEIMDEWSMMLSDDLPAGEYQVFTGMYEWPSLERLQVTDGGGQPVENSLIYLGTVKLNP